MAGRRLNILLIAEEGAGLELLKMLSQSEHRVTMVLTSPPDVPGSAIWRFAEKRGHRLLPAKTVKDPGFADVIRKDGVDLLLNVHSLYIVPNSILDAPQLGSFNMHPGPLPRYAGLNAPSWAIYRGERQHGVTIHHMIAGIDAGPIAYQSIFALHEQDTGLSVSVRCVKEGLQLMSALVEAAAGGPGSIPRIEQDLSRREYFGREIPHEGIVVWNRPAQEVSRFIRASCYHPFPSPWGRPKVHLRGREVGIVKASLTGEPALAPPGTVAAGGEKRAWVACADVWLEVSHVHVDGKTVCASDVLKPGDRLAHPGDPGDRGRG